MFQLCFNGEKKGCFGGDKRGFNGVPMVRKNFLDGKKRCVNVFFSGEKKGCFNGQKKLQR